ncbi:MAG: type II and III secretion system protein [Planctomycetes bacterium]|nr:type II and III secretion system protein [Planctomycetota bacterium]
MKDRLGNIAVLLKALQEKGYVNVVHVPQVVTVDHGNAKMNASTAVPIPQTTYAGGAGTTVQSFTFETAQTMLTISPHISEGGYLRLEVEVQIEKFLPATSPGAPPAKSSRTINTRALVPDGRTVVIGGLVTQDASETESKVPLLGDVPVLGELFRRTEKRLDKTTLYILLTPRILYDDAFGDWRSLSQERRAVLEAARGEALPAIPPERTDPRPVSTFRYRAE